MRDIKYRKIKILRAVFVLFLLCAFAIIVKNSLENPELSTERSQEVFRTIAPLLEKVFKIENVSETLIRKIAHVVEFALLGMISETLFILNNLCRDQVKENWRNTLAVKHASASTALIGILMATIDETIQLYSNRGSNVMDIWIDFSGVLIGTVCAVILFVLCLLLFSSRGRKMNRRKLSRE